MKTLWTPVALLALTMLAPQVSANEVDLTFDSDLTVLDRKISYNLSLRLAERGPTRIGTEALLDLTNLQSTLPGIVNGHALVDLCTLRAEIRGMDLAAQGGNFVFSGTLAADMYSCARDGLTATDRGPLVLSQDMTLTVTAGVRVEDNCVTLNLADMAIDLTGAVQLTDAQKQASEKAGDLLVAVVERLMANHPVCPKLPPELASLEPRYDTGGTTEIGEGGLGLSLRGSTDVSTGTILDILQVLQDRGVLPPKP